MGRTLGNGRYIKGALLGRGTFGAVYKATDSQTGEVVAVKKIHFKEEDREKGVNVTALREIKLLKELQHENVIRLVDVFVHKANLNLAFQVMESDLEAVIQDRTTVLSPGDVKSYMQMTLRALAYCHSKWVLHRDMKPNNLFIASTGHLKLGDFGLARTYGSPNPKLTPEVFASWYRAPELLFGSRAYTSAVDIWGAGCVFAELLLRRPFLQGSSTLDQLGKIFSAFGTPKESQWPNVTCLPDYVEFYPTPPQPLRSLFPMATEDALDLLARMFTFDPTVRITAKQALEHRYFQLGPPPTDPAHLPRPPRKREPAAAISRINKVLSPVSEGEANAEPPRHRARRDDGPGTLSRGSENAKMAIGETPAGGGGGSGVPMSVDTAPQGTAGVAQTPNSSGLKPLKRKLDDLFS